jgi:hypothetical protein
MGQILCPLILLHIRMLLQGKLLGVISLGYYAGLFTAAFLPILAFVDPVRTIVAVDVKMTERA